MTSRLVAVMRAVFYPCALALVAFMAYEAARQTDFAELHWGPLGAALVTAVVWWVALGVGWASLVGGDTREAVAMWCRTQVARYLPGGVWQVVARAATVEGRIRDKVTTVTAENVIVLLVALSVGGVWAGLHDWRWLGLALLVLAPLLASRWLEQRTRLSRRSVHRAAGSYAVGYVAYGLTGVLVQVAVSGWHDPGALLYVAGAACVAWAVGLVVVFAPGGVGVREVVYIWMLSGLYPRPELEAAAVASRLVTVAAELGVLALVSRPRRSQDRPVDNPPPDPAPDDRSTDSTSPRRST